MSLAIQCILERELPHVSPIEGKHLLAAYLGELDRFDAPAEPRVEGNLIYVDFGGPLAYQAQATDESRLPLFAPLQPFLHEPGRLAWHAPSSGLKAVREMLDHLHHPQVTVAAPVDYLPGYDDPVEVREGLHADLEDLEQILIEAHRHRVRFCLVFGL